MADAVKEKMLAELVRQFERQNCTCSFLKYIGGTPPCQTCQLGAFIQEVRNDTR